MVSHLELDRLWRALHFAADEVLMFSSYQPDTRTWDRTRPRLCVLCNDMYMWGGADAESITLDDIPRLVQLTQIDASWAPYLLTGDKRQSFDVQAAIQRLPSWQEAVAKAAPLWATPAPELPFLPEIAALTTDEVQVRWELCQALLPLLIGGWNLMLETTIEDDAPPVPLGLRVAALTSSVRESVVTEDIWHRVEWADVPALIQAHQKAGIMGVIVWTARRIDPDYPERLFTNIEDTASARDNHLNMSPKDAMNLLDQT